ncbi:MAG: hypothetical protein M3Q96_06910 [Pseudomonadota bacterium]|nr:hypothetical protein [Pseudomonadota bacterium]MDQ3228752.1 hypothetical protein [Pseudomonadota bacterium]
MPNRFLVVAAVLSGLAALLHVGCIYFGAPWYRFFGAGEEMARMAEAGSWVPGFITAGIAIVLGIWALYALSGAGAFRKLPLLRTALCIITGVYLLRGLVVFPVAFLHPQEATAFAWWSSAICLGLGIVHLVGIRQRWQAMSVAG